MNIGIRLPVIMQRPAWLFPFLLGLTLALCASLAYAQPLRITPGMPFLQARQQILQSRWQPYPSPASRGTEPIGVERILIDHGIPEVEFCAIDQAVCTFTYKKNQACLTVTTHGETPQDMTVLKWSYRCPRDD